MKIRKRKPLGKKNKKYIEELYALHSKKLFHRAQKYMKDADLAEDVVQSVFENVLLYPDGILKVPKEDVFYFLTVILKHEIGRAHV